MVIKDVTDVCKRYAHKCLLPDLDTEQVKRVCIDLAEEDLSNSLEHGQEGPYLFTVRYKVEDAYFAVKLEPYYNRYDKQFYYLDGFDSKTCEEIHPTDREKAMRVFEVDLMVPMKVEVEATNIDEAFDIAIKKNPGAVNAN